VNTDWGRGAVTAFGDVVKRTGSGVGAVEYMDQAATDMNAQITKIKADGGDTLFVTTSVEQITLILKQAQEQRLGVRFITTGGSAAPNQLIKQAGPAAEGTYHILFFLPWFPEAMPDPKLAKAFVDEWNKRGYPAEGVAEGFRGHDGYHHRRRGHPPRRQGRAEGDPRRALAGQHHGRERADQVREGRAGRQGERAEPPQHLPRPDQGREGGAALVRGQEVARGRAAPAWTSSSSTSRTGCCSAPRTACSASG
jgi:hypothetical protein